MEVTAMPEQINNQVPPAKNKQLPRTTVDPETFEHELTEIYLELKGTFTPDAIRAKHPTPMLDRKWLKKHSGWEPPTVKVTDPESVRVCSASVQIPTITADISEGMSPIPVKEANVSYEKWESKPITLPEIAIPDAANLPKVPSITIANPQVFHCVVKKANMPTREVLQPHISVNPVLVSQAKTDFEPIQIQVANHDFFRPIQAKIPESIAFQMENPTWEPLAVLHPNTKCALHYEHEVKVEAVPVIHAVSEPPEISVGVQAEWTIPVSEAKIPSVTIDVNATNAIQSVAVKTAATGIPEIQVPQPVVSPISVTIPAIPNVEMNLMSTNTFDMTCRLEPVKPIDDFHVTPLSMTPKAVPVMLARMQPVPNIVPTVDIEPIPVHVADVEFVDISAPQLKSMPVDVIMPQLPEKWQGDIAIPSVEAVPFRLANTEKMDLAPTLVDVAQVPVHEATISPCPQFGPDDFKAHDLHFDIPQLPEPPDLGLPKRRAVQPTMNPVFFEGVKIMEELGLIDVFAREGIILDLKRGNPE
jgi:hypothetical protein